MHKCSICGKPFDERAALENHMKDKHEEAPPAKKSGKSLKKLIIAAAVILAVASISVLILSKPSYTPRPQELHVKGSGAIEIVEYSDFQCPACGIAYPQTKEFVDGNLDKVRFVYKHFPLTQLHPYAFKAAEASECAADQGKFWEYHDKLFENQANLLRPDLLRYAEDTGLDRKMFSACLDSGAISGRVSADSSEAQSRGVRATPTFFIKGKKFESVVSASQFESEVRKP